MNTSRLATLTRFVLAAGCVAAATSAHAGGGVYWAVNVDAPMQGAGRVSTSVSNTPRGVYVQPAPVYYAPAPVVYAPAPVVYRPAPVVVQPPARIYMPPPMVVYEEPRRQEPRGPWGWRHRHHHHHHDRGDDRYAWGYER